MSLLVVFSTNCRIRLTVVFDERVFDEKSCTGPNLSLYARPLLEVFPTYKGHILFFNQASPPFSFILALFESTTVNEIDSEDTQYYKRLLPVYEAEILRVTVKNN